MATVTTESPRILSRSEHSVSRDNIDASAIKVLYRLHKSNYLAYVVGGGVRDLMLGIEPKDFDISTDARPPAVRRLFRNSRIIGRRFRLAHIYFQDGIVEVATFRRDPDPEAQRGAPGDLLITDDNVFGTPRQDAFRRDFTVNALFYNIADYSVIDYVGGIEDLRDGRIRIIGEPDVRFQEDPVRMTRACEMAARLDFGIDPETQEAIFRNRGEIDRAAPARITEEIIGILRCGQAGRALQWMMELGLLDTLLPEAITMLSAPDRGLGDLAGIVSTVDRQIREKRKLSDVAVIAALLLPGVLMQRQRVEEGRSKPLRRGELQNLISEAVSPFFARFTVSRQREEYVTQALLAIDRLNSDGWREADRVRFASRPYFDDALDLFRLFAETTATGKDRLAAWERVLKHRPRPPKAERKPRPRPQRTRGRRRPRH